MTLTYTQHYIQVTREELIIALRQRITAKHFEHVLRVEQQALALAEQYGADKEAVSIAALMHDYAKDMQLSAMATLATTYWEYPGLSEQNSNILHGFAAAQICRQEYGCCHEGILNAIAGHTIGWYQMDLIAKIVYMADYIEPGRNFPGVEVARELSAHNLDDAVWFKMQATLKYLVDERVPLFAGAIDIYNSWTKQEDL